MAFIIKPLVTEKMTKITDKSSVDRTYRVKSKGGEERTKKATPKYGFIVKPEANKIEIKKEVEGLYNVTVIDVNTIRYARKAFNTLYEGWSHQGTEECVQESNRYSERGRYYRFL